MGCVRGVGSRDEGTAKRPPPHLLGDAILLHQRLLGVVEHQRVVGRERDVEPDREEFVEGILRQLEEEEEEEVGMEEVVEMVEVWAATHLEEQRVVAQR